MIRSFASKNLFLQRGGAGLSAEMYSLELCENGLWCCNNQIVSTCCNNNEGNFTFNLLSLAPSSKLDSSANTTAITATATSYITEAPNGDESSKSSHINSSVVVGASVGTVLSVLLIACCVALFLLMRRLKKVKKEMDNRKMEPQLFHGRVEMDTERVILPELQGTAMTKHELDGQQIKIT